MTRRRGKRAPRAEELWVEKTLSRVLALRVEHVDDGSLDGMVDALIHRRDGTTEPLEITTLADPRALQMNKMQSSFPADTPYRWELRYQGSWIDLRDVRSRIPGIVAALDLAGLQDSEDADALIESLPHGEWFLASELQLRVIQHYKQAGRVYLIPDAFGGFVDEHLTGLADWVGRIRTEDIWTENVAKLARSGLDRLHLALIVHRTGAPFDIWFELADVEEIRAPKLAPIAPLTDLWLFGTSGNRVVHWSDATGWQVHPGSNVTERG